MRGCKNASGKHVRNDIDFNTIGNARRMAAASVVGNPTTTQTMPQTMPYSPLFSYTTPCFMIPVLMSNVPMPITGPPVPQQPETCTKCVMREMDEVAEQLQMDKDRFHLQRAEDALAVAMAKIKKAQVANNFLQDELTALGDEYTSLDQDFKKLGRLCKETEHIGQSKAILAQVGGKCERLRSTSGSLHDMANAAVARHRKMARLLQTTQQRHSGARQAFEAAKGHLKHREGEAINEKKDAQRECEEQGRLARELAGEATECRRSMATMLQELCETKAQLQTAIAKNTQLQSKWQRAKSNATTFFDEKKKALNEREDAIASLPMCAICMARDVQLVVNLPCGHACSCKICSDTTRPCAICRGDVMRAVPVYFVSG